MSLRDRLRGLALALALALAGAPAWAAFDLDALMAVLAQRKSGEAKFAEERFVGGIDGPLRASGLLRFAAPDRFTRETLLPRPESMEVQGNTLTLKRGGRVRSLELDAIPELAALTDALRGTLSGDAKTLQRHFRTAVVGQRDRWTLKLLPSDTTLSRQVREIEISGQGPDVIAVELSMVGGDRSVMHIEPLRALPAASAPAR